MQSFRGSRTKPLTSALKHMPARERSPITRRPLAARPVTGSQLRRALDRLLAGQQPHAERLAVAVGLISAKRWRALEQLHRGT